MKLNDAIVQQVWEKGRATQERDPAQWREDECGAWMQHEQFNNANSEFGWHIRHTQGGGEESLEHLRPFHVENEYNLMAQAPVCRITADRSHVAPTARLGKPKNRSA